MGDSGDEVGEQNRLVAVRAHASRAEPASEVVAVGAAMVAEHAVPAVGAFVDRLPFGLTDRSRVDRRLGFEVSTAAQCFHATGA